MNGILDGSKLLGLEPLTGDCHPQETTAFDPFCNKLGMAEEIISIQMAFLVISYLSSTIPVSKIVSNVVLRRKLYLGEDPDLHH